MSRAAVLGLVLLFASGAIAPSAPQTDEETMGVVSAVPEGGDEGGGGELVATPVPAAEDGGDDDGGDEGGGGGGGGEGGGGPVPAEGRNEASPTTMAALESGALETEEMASSKESMEATTDGSAAAAGAADETAAAAAAAADGTSSSTAASPSEESAPRYRLTNRGGETCILLQMDAVVNIKYETRNKGTRELEKYVPMVEAPYGICGDDEARLVIEWRTFQLRWSFSKTPGGERWYVNLVELQYDKSDTMFENASSTGEVTLSTRRAHGTMLFPTPVGRSYHCRSDYLLQLSDGSDSDEATLLLRQFRMQPFMYKDDFGPSFECSPGGVTKFRDETAPIAVGSTLAVVVLLTVTGYGVYRYFKIKKVQYDTME